MKLFLLPLVIIVGLIYLWSGPASQSSARPSLVMHPVEPIDREAEAFDRIIQKYDSILVAGVDSFNTVGAAAVVTYKGKIAYLRCFGVREKGKSESINEHTIFRLASVSKSVTGILAGMLHQQGVIDLDEPVSHILNGFNLKDSISTRKLTVRHLLSHTSGLVPHAYDDLVEAHVPMDEIMKRLADVNISAAPGTLYGYQNVMFSLYDTIARLKTGLNYNALLTNNLFNASGMKDASSGFEAFLNNNNKAIPHGRYKGDYVSLKLNDRYYNTAPAAGVNASISDLAHLLSHITSKKDTILDSSVLSMVFEPQVKSPLKRRYLTQWDKVDSKDYGLGWRIIGYKGRSIAYHGGFVDGYRAEMAVSPDDEIGVAFLTNSPNKMASIVVPEFLNLFFAELNSELDL